MQIIITKDSERLAAYHCKRTNTSKRAIRGIKRFYATLYPTSKINVYSER